MKRFHFDASDSGQMVREEQTDRGLGKQHAKWVHIQTEDCSLNNVPNLNAVETFTFGLGYETTGCADDERTCPNRRIDKALSDDLGSVKPCGIQH